MKIKLLSKVSFALMLGWINPAFCQGGGSSASAVRFEQYPVELSTGLPQVSFPLYSMPTRSKDVTLNMSLSYHQSSIGRYGLRSGNCGRGWDFSLGGLLRMDASSPGVFNFNFMGYSGKFVAFVPENNQTVNIIIYENKGPKLHCEAVSLNGTTKFTFFDELGYRYVFSVPDKVHRLNNDNSIILQNLAYHLTDIYDHNKSAANNYEGNLLAHFDYSTYEEIVQLAPGLAFRRTNIINMMSNVTVPGYGAIEVHSSGFTDTDGQWFLYTGADIKDFLGNEIKNFVLYTDSQYDAELGLYSMNLIGLTESGPGGANSQHHTFYYKPIPALKISEKGGTDEWGYRNKFPKKCDQYSTLTSAANQYMVAEGVLEKISFPTGGCVIYNYESNTYSYDGHRQMDLDQNGNIIPDYYTDLYMAQNKHNYTFTTLAEDFSQDFVINVPTEVYITVYGESFTDPVLGGWSNPTFELKGPGSFSRVIETDDAGDNNCMGYKILLQPGTYRIITSGGINKSCRVYTAKPRTTLQRYWHGGGIRVAAVAFFDTDVAQDFFDLFPSTYNPIPAKAKYYNYQLFSDPNMSSGATASFPGSDYTPIIYSNVTVRETKSIFGVTDERTEYTFYSPIDFLSPGNQTFTHDFRLGKLKNKKVYDTGNTLQLETLHTYESLNPTELNSHLMGWIMPKETITVEYFESGAISTTQNFQYDANRNISKKTVRRVGAPNVITNYYYHLDANGNPFTTNRVSALDHVDEFEGAEQLGSAKVEYQNSWSSPQGNVVNVAHMPSQVLRSKATVTAETEHKNTMYDMYGNLLETERRDGTKKSIIYGYQNSLPVAEIEGVAYASIPSVLIDAVKNASNSGNQASLLSALSNLRGASQLSDAIMTSYTYKPLIGISTVTDARGYRMSYEYDALGRQTVIRDQDNNIVSDKTYNLKPQN